MTKIAIIGSKGRMGSALLACVSQHRNIKVVAQVDKDNNQNELEVAIHAADVVVDFSSQHEATFERVKLCAMFEKSMVIGTTGHEFGELEGIKSYRETIPIVMTSNFSTGVNGLFWLTRKAAEILGPDFDLEVVEMHHRLKLDAPSGTAKSLVGILKYVRQNQLHESEVDPIPHVAVVHGRSGNTGGRQNNEICVHSIRGGDVVGDHTVVFATNGERVELTHKASSRDTFANGALRAAVWVAQQKPGFYDMQDVLGLPK